MVGEGKQQAGQRRKTELLKFRFVSNFHHCIFMTKHLSFLTMALAMCASLHAASFPVRSPDGKSVVTLDCSDSVLTYSLSTKGEMLVESSVVSLFKEANYEVVGSETKAIDETWKPTWGQFSEIRDHCQQLTLKVEASGLRVDLVCQIYNDGVGIRFVVPEQEGLNEKVVIYQFDCQVAGDYSAYWAHPGSGVPPGPFSSKALSKGKRKIGGAPFIMKTDKGPWLALLESDLFSAGLFPTGKLAMKPGTSTVQMTARANQPSDGFLTPWRVILLGEQAGDLIVNNVALNLAAPCQIEDTSWIKAGLGLWDWRVHGYDNGKFTYDIDTRSFLHYVDFCAAQGIPYFTIDDHWFLKAGDGKMEVSPNVDIKKVMAYAKEKGVGIMLYYDRKKGNFGDETLFKHYSELGASGMKYGFMGSRADFTRDAIRSAAENKLMLFFHDGPVPMAGVERTMPNMISREYCHGQQDSRSAFLPSTFIKMAMINALTGPLDMSNGNFGLVGINAGERKKGPKKKHSYISTVASEVARCLVIPSALVTLPDAPEEYLKKADLFAFLQAMPATWDETRVLHGKIGEYVTIARRSGDIWFVGSVNSEAKPRDLEIPLGFLKGGATYEATLYMDAPETDGVKNPEAYKIEKQTLKDGDVITAKMALGGGHAMILRLVK